MTDISDDIAFAVYEEYDRMGEYSSPEEGGEMIIKAVLAHLDVVPYPPYVRDDIESVGDEPIVVPKITGWEYLNYIISEQAARIKELEDAIINHRDGHTQHDYPANRADFFLWALVEEDND